MLYRVLKVVLGMVAGVFFRFSVSGAENIPAGGRAILVANHSSYLDPILLGLASPRKLAFMAKEQLFRFSPLGWLIGALGGFPVRQGVGDRQAVRTALAVLEAGEVLVLFPEGGRRFDELGKPQRGTALLARKTGAAIVPAAIIGAGKVKPKGRLLPRFPKLEVRIGQGRFVDAEADKESMEQAMEQAMASIADLMGSTAV